MNYLPLDSDSRHDTIDHLVSVHRSCCFEAFPLLPDAGEEPASATIDIGYTTSSSRSTIAVSPRLDAEIAAPSLAPLSFGADDPELLHH